jgi:hypothetical protein
VAWVSNKRLKKITAKDWNQFLPLCPDFVLELRSPRDRLPALQDKMAEYVANGAQLGWLLDPNKKQVHIYRPDLPPEVLNDPVEVSADPVLPGFRLPFGQRLVENRVSGVDGKVFFKRRYATDSVFQWNPWNKFHGYSQGSLRDRGSSDFFRCFRPD